MILEYDNPYAVGLTGLLGNKAGSRTITGGKLLLMFLAAIFLGNMLGFGHRICRVHCVQGSKQIY